MKINVYQFIDTKKKDAETKGSIVQLWDENGIYKGQEEISELLKISFQNALKN